MLGDKIYGIQISKLNESLEFLLNHVGTIVFSIQEVKIITSLETQSFPLLELCSALLLAYVLKVSLWDIHLILENTMALTDSGIIL